MKMKNYPIIFKDKIYSKQEKKKKTTTKKQYYLPKNGTIVSFMEKQTYF